MGLPKKIDISNIWGTVATSIQTRNVAVVWQSKPYTLQIDHANGTLLDIKKELEARTKVRYKRQVLKGLESLPDDTVVNTIPNYIMDKQLIMLGDPSVDIMDAFDTTEMEEAAAAAEAEAAKKKVNAGAAGRNRTPLERADDHRQKGNALFREGLFEEALDLYTRAVNALKDDVKALSNRSACWASMAKFKEALFDAEMAISYDPNWPKLWGRKGLAHFYLKQFDEAVAAYSKQADMDPENFEAKKNVGRSEVAGGNMQRIKEKEKAQKLANEQRRLAERDRLAKYGGDGFGGARDEHAKYKLALEHHEERLKTLRKERREAINTWRRSCRTEMERPEEKPGGSIRVDVFGHLRGACRKTGCMMWNRDISKMNGWSDMNVLKCEDCGGAHQDHEDCGVYDPNDPPPPKPPGKQAEAIAGVHHATADDFKAMAGKGGVSSSSEPAISDPTINLKRSAPGKPATYSTKDFQSASSSVAEEERPSFVDLFGQMRGHCESCGQTSCSEYKRPEPKQTGFNPNGITVNFNDTSLLLCDNCGCDATHHASKGSYDNREK